MAWLFIGADNEGPATNATNDIFPPDLLSNPFSSTSITIPPHKKKEKRTEQREGL